MSIDAAFPELVYYGTKKGSGQTAKGGHSFEFVKGVYLEDALGVVPICCYAVVKGRVVLLANSNGIFLD
jgi:hypothetical protein